MSRFLVAGLGLLFLAACATTQVQDARTKFVALESAVAASETLALAYVSLPACPQAKLCSDTNIVQGIQKTKRAIDAAVAGGRSVFANPGATADAQAQALAAAQGALIALQTYLDNPQVKAATAGGQ